MIGELFEEELYDSARVEIEHLDGRRRPLPVQDWLASRPGDTGLLDHCQGATLDVGSGPGRLTAALAHRGTPVLGIDAAPRAVALAIAAGAPTLCRDVFGRVPGAGRWRTILLADGNIGIGGDPDPAALLRRVLRLLGPGGQVLTEVDPPGTSSRTESLRLRSARAIGDWFPWAHVSTDGADALAASCDAAVTERWEEADRWFVALRGRQPAPHFPGNVMEANRTPHAESVINDAHNEVPPIDTRNWVDGRSSGSDRRALQAPTPWANRLRAP
ncbi:SAM-dependent methyltransferase [Actinomadura luteofluorescens]|uniref:SAM-dependent methyltransferase n=1 Tax=Actinomadura luteofluorescens TaxID=46163 RepID=A0A7Y9EBK5_9ACTN|nr:class I SAM-dependent methyltransferase [Actinomadura luteofluorescens]NYD44775.1 SAM-dependent methyltransferase [Actinomadura luteofluorescens]